MSGEECACVRREEEGGGGAGQLWFVFFLSAHFTWPFYTIVKIKIRRHFLDLKKLLINVHTLVTRIR